MPSSGKTHHFSLIDLIDDDETLEEQETLDQHDDDVTTLAVHIRYIQRLITLSSATPTNSDHRKVKLQHLEKSLSLVNETVSSLSSKILLIIGQLSDYKKLADFRNSLLWMDLEEGDEFLASLIALSRSRSYCDTMLILMTLHLALHTQTQGSQTPKVGKQQSKQESPSARKRFASSKPVALFAASTNSTTSLCLACKTEKHPLYACTKFKSMPQDK